MFQPILKGLRIPKRDLYCARHAFISQALENGMPVTQVAYLAGNSPETIYRFYANIIEVPKEIPSF